MKSPTNRARGNGSDESDARQARKQLSIAGWDTAENTGIAGALFMKLPAIPPDGWMFNHLSYCLRMTYAERTRFCNFLMNRARAIAFADEDAPAEVLQASAQERTRLARMIREWGVDVHMFGLLPSRRGLTYLKGLVPSPADINLQLPLKWRAAAPGSNGKAGAL